MKVTFWGTRGSLPSPLDAAEIENKIRQAIRAIWQMPDVDTQNLDDVLARVGTLPLWQRGTIGGHTSCVEIEAEGTTFIIDAGSGMTKLGQKLMQGPCGKGQGILHIFFSHCHWDHLIGFPMFVPAFIPGNHLIFYGVHDVERSLRRQLNPENWPIDLDYMAADKTFVTLEPGVPITIDHMRVDTLQNPHPGHSYAYRFQDQHSTLVYSSDVEFKQLDDDSVRPHTEFFRNADALIYDAQYTLREAWNKVDFGHSSALIGVDLARAAGVKQLLLFHHDPTYSDGDLEQIQATAMAYQAQDPTRPVCKVTVAHDGLSLNLTQPGTADIQLSPGGEAAILTPVRVFDELGVDQLADQLADLCAENPSSIVDLSQVKTLTTGGLQALVRLRQACKGVPVVLVSPSKQVRRVADLAGYLDYFAIYPSVDAALEAVQTREALNLPGQVLKGRYQIEGKIGNGELGTVLRALDLETRQRVAVKVLFPHFGQDIIDRFARLTPQIIALDHPNIVKMLAWEQEETYSFKVETLMEAPTLAKHLADHEDRLETDQAMSIALNIARALEYAHSLGVVHGDLKPTNVFITEDGARVSGFGQGRLEEGRNLLDVPPFFTNAAYLAPEQILGQPLDARTDLYALGVILYRLFTGELPFTGTEKEKLNAHLHRAPCPPRVLNPDLSLSLEHLLLKLLSKNPNERYTSAEQTWRISQNLLVHSEDITRARPAFLVGRNEERAALIAHWEIAHAGQGQLVLISGEPGVGKTSLAQLVASECEPLVLLEGQCQDMQGAPPYRLFAQLLRTYAATVPPEFHNAEARDLLGNLGRLVPELGQMLPDLSTPPPLRPEQEQLRIMASLTEFIKLATQERPWLLILDDLQWADNNSLELLRYLGRHVQSMPLFVIGIYCDSGLERGHLLRDVASELGMLSNYHHMRLERLNREQVGELLHHIWQQAVPADLIDKIYQCTEGNPFFVEEVAQGLVDDGLITRRDGQWHYPELDSVRLPQSVHDAVWQRIGHLNPDTLTLLSQAAVLGPTFSMEDLREMAGLTRWEVLEYLGVALERYLVQELSTEGMLRFRHPEIQYVLYDDLGPLRRRMLHRQAGETLERRAQPEPEHIAETLARHFTEAGVHAKALTYSVAAARQAQAAYANEAALVWYRRILNLLASPDLESEVQFAMLKLTAHRAMGEVLTLLGQHAEALEHYTEALAWLETQTVFPRQKQDLADLCHRIAGVHERRSEFEAASEWVQKGLAYLEDDDPTAEMVQMYILSGRVLLYQGKHEGAQLGLQRALHLARALGLRQAEAEALRTLGAASWRLGDYAQAQQYAEQALAINREIGDREGESNAINLLGIVAADQGEYATAQHHLEETLRIRRETGDIWGESTSLNNLGVLLWQQGDPARAYAYYRQALQLYRKVGNRLGENRSLNNLGLVLRDMGDFTQATAYCQQALTHYRELGDRWGEASSMNNLAQIYRNLGLYEKALTNQEQARHIQRAIGDRAGEAESLAFLALLAHYQGQSAQAHEYAEQAQHLAQEVGDRSRLAHALTYLGHAHLDLGETQAAIDAYREATALRETLGELNRMMESLAGLAAAQLAQSNPDDARETVQRILAHIEASPELSGATEPFDVYLTCYRVLRSDGAAEAATLLETAHALLIERAEKITDPDLRHTFLNSVATHRALLQAGTLLDKGQ